MGWLYKNTYTRKQDIKNEIVNTISDGYRVLDHGSGSKGFYVAYESNNETFVVFYKTSCCKGYWGYKDMELSMCPYDAYDMPKKLLKYVNLEECSSWYKMWENNQSEKKKAKLIKVGDKFKWSGEVFVVGENYNKTGSQVLANSGTKIYRFKRDSIVSKLIS